MKLVSWLGSFCLVLGLSQAASAQTVHTVAVNGTSFGTANLLIKQGDTVRWMWIFSYHTVTEGSDGVVNGNEAFNYIVDPFNPFATHKFDTAFLQANPRPGNKYFYFCSNPSHGGMTAAVTVMVPWSDLGFAKAGTSGNPALVGLGDMYPNTPGALRLTNALPNAPALLFVAGGANTPVSFLGGMLAAYPVTTTLATITSGSGQSQLNFTFPALSAPGSLITFQWAVADPGATNGVALSNAVRARLP